jgi:hypothetical protein
MTTINEEAAEMLAKTFAAQVQLLERRVAKLEEHVSDILNKDVRAPLGPEQPTEEK